MITINLAPIDELEDKYWYVPDVILVVLLAMFGWFGLQTYMEQKEQEIVHVHEAQEELDRNTQRLKPDLERFDHLNTQVEILKEKLLSLRKITVSRLERYRPIILIEHLQNLKPEGVWFTSLKDDTAKKIIQISGGAFDNLLVSEFMASLAATRQQGIDPHNIRSQVYFSQVFLEQVSSNLGNGTLADVQNKDFDAKNPQGDSKQQAQIAFRDLQDKDLVAKQQAPGGPKDAFPEIHKFPQFELNIKYAERMPESEQVERK